MSDTMSVSSEEQDIVRGRWLALAMLSGIYACMSVDRQVVAVIAEPVKHEFGLTDTEVGFLTGLAFTISYSIACVPFGWLLDRGNRRNLLTAVVALWSGLTMAGALATGYLWLLLARIGVGTFESGGQPGCMSLISDLFGPRERSTAIGLFYLSGAVGIAFSFLLGGYVAADYGWRAALLVAGFPGLLLAGSLFLSFKEPSRRRDHESNTVDLEPAPRLVDVVRHAIRAPGLLHIAAGITITSMAIASFWFWVSSFLIRIHGFDLKSAGALSAAAAIAQAIGAAAIGRLADRIAREQPTRLALVPMTTSLLGAFAGVWFVQATNPAMTIILLLLVALLVGAYLGPSYSIALGSVPPKMRGVTTASIQVSANLLGLGLGPLIVGAISDHVGGPLSLRPALSIVLTVNLWAALHFYLAYRALRARARSLS